MELNKEWIEIKFRKWAMAIKNRQTTELPKWMNEWMNENWMNVRAATIVTEQQTDSSAMPN